MNSVAFSIFSIAVDFISSRLIIGEAFYSPAKSDNISFGNCSILVLEVQCNFYTAPGKFENVALFLRLS